MYVILCLSVACPLLVKEKSLMSFGVGVEVFPVAVAEYVAGPVGNSYGSVPYVAFVVVLAPATVWSPY